MMLKYLKWNNYLTKLLNFYLKFKWLYFFSDKIFVGKNLLVKKAPLVTVKHGCKLIIGNNVTLNSMNDGYHLNMFSRIKLYCDRLGAEIKIGDNTRIHGSCIHSYNSISIGKNCLIAANCQIFDGNGHDLSMANPAVRINTVGESDPIKIEDNVWIGANTFVLPGVMIGQGSVITANSVVANNIPPYSLAGGNPAVIIKNYKKLGM